MISKIIIIGGSAGSFKVVGRILSSLPSNFRIPVVICMHRLRNVRSGFVNTLSINSHFKIKEAFDKEKILNGLAYIAPANYHLMIEPDYSFTLSVEAPVKHSRPAIDITMETAAEVFRQNCIGILLSGANNDGTEGMAKIHKEGGYTMVQDPAHCEITTMPESCLKLIKPKLVGDVDTIIKKILEIEKGIYFP